MLLKLYIMLICCLLNIGADQTSFMDYKLQEFILGWPNPEFSFILLAAKVEGKFLNEFIKCLMIAILHVMKNPPFPDACT